MVALNRALVTLNCFLTRSLIWCLLLALPGSALAQNGGPERMTLTVSLADLTEAQREQISSLESRDAVPPLLVFDGGVFRGFAPGHIPLDHTRTLTLQVGVAGISQIPLYSMQLDVEDFGKETILVDMAISLFGDSASRTEQNDNTAVLSIDNIQHRSVKLRRISNLNYEISLPGESYWNIVELSRDMYWKNDGNIRNQVIKLEKLRDLAIYLDDNNIRPHFYNDYGSRGEIFLAMTSGRISWVPTNFGLGPKPSGEETYSKWVISSDPSEATIRFATCDGSWTTTAEITLTNACIQNIVIQMDDRQQCTFQSGKIDANGSTKLFHCDLTSIN